MQLIVGQGKKEYPASITVEELLKMEKVEMPQYVTVQVNEEFVRSEDFASTELSEGDRVEFMYYMGGGK